VLDQKLIRENPTSVEESLSLRGKVFNISQIQELTLQKKEIDIEISSLQSESKKLSKLIGQEISKSKNNDSPEVNNLKIKCLLRKVFNFLRLHLFNVLSTKNITLILVSFSVFGFSFIQSKYFSLEKIQMSFITLLLGFVFYLSFMGIKSNPSVSNVRKTIDIIGAPFVVAALLLANLTYLKIL